MIEDSYNYLLAKDGFIVIDNWLDIFQEKSVAEFNINNYIATASLMQDNEINTITNSNGINFFRDVFLSRDKGIDICTCLCNNNLNCADTILANIASEITIGNNGVENTAFIIFLDDNSSVFIKEMQNTIKGQKGRVLFVRDSDITLKGQIILFHIKNKMVTNDITFQSYNNGITLKAKVQKSVEEIAFVVYGKDNKGDILLKHQLMPVTNKIAVLTIYEKEFESIGLSFNRFKSMNRLETYTLTKEEYEAWLLNVIKI